MKRRSCKTWNISPPRCLLGKTCSYTCPDYHLRGKHKDRITAAEHERRRQARIKREGKL